MNTEINLPREVLQCLEILNQAGYEAFCVGGCVRDWLMGLSCQDFDITTSARPEEAKMCFQDYRTIDSGIRHGTITIIINNISIECTTYRTESSYEHHRKPAMVHFTDSLKEDCARRDFTINALCYHPELGIQDFYHGIQDLKNHVLRAIGSPNERFEEDALRILRALRFRSVLGFKIEEKTHKAMQIKKSLIHHLTNERISQEVNKLIVGKGAGIIVEEESDILNELFPGITELRGYPKLFQELLNLLTVTPASLVLRLACLLGLLQRHQSDHIPALALSHPYSSGWLRQYHYSNELIKAVTIQIEMQERALPHNKIELKQLLSLYDVDPLRLNMEYHKALGINVDSCLMWLDEVIHQNECWKVSSLDIKGNEVQEITQCRPEEIGTYLKTLLEAVIENKVSNLKPSLMQYLLQIKRTETI